MAESVVESELCSSKDALKVDNSPPPWLQQYITKMKQEIKEELLEEIMSSSSEPRQEHVSEAQHSGASAVLKEEKVSLCLAEEGGEVVHSDIYCDNCDQLIHGIRYKCGNCSDFDLCQECESLPNVHNKNHIFLKIRYPNALKMWQKQKWSELMSPLPMKPLEYHACSRNRNKTERKLYEAKFLSDETVPDGFSIPPSTPFIKSWKVMNSGCRVWTHATKLHLIQGSVDLVPSSDQIDVPHLKPEEEGIVSVLFTSPSTPGVYRSHWNFCHKSRPFGQIVWCHIVVKPVQEILRNDLSESSKKLLEKNMAHTLVEKQRKCKEGWKKDKLKEEKNKKTDHEHHHKKKSIISSHERRIKREHHEIRRKLKEKIKINFKVR